MSGALSRNPFGPHSQRNPSIACRAEMAACAIGGFEDHDVAAPGVVGEAMRTREAGDAGPDDCYAGHGYARRSTVRHTVWRRPAWSSFAFSRRCRSNTIATFRTNSRPSARDVDAALAQW